MRARAIEYGLKLNEYELAGEKKSVKCKDEADIFAALDLDYIPPELREDTGEIEAAAAHRLPKLIEFADLRGTFHCHTNWSDGAATLEEMADAAKKRGLKYLGIADHSQTAAYAGGLTVERVRKQHAEIDALNAKQKNFRIFKGIESDILPDGRLDYTDDVLASFDYIVASIHSSFTMSREEMTQRVIRAVSHPKCTMLGHATGRLLLRRDGFQVDLDAVIDACARAGTMIEINANPLRLDLDWQYCKRAKSKGVRLVINPDAHSTTGLDDLRYGIDVARRGWLEAADGLNTRSAAEVAPLLGS
jgi:DNA polymerase (family 10)